MSAWVAAPVLLGAFIGSWLDEQQGTEPWFFLGSVGVAFLISIIGLVLEAGKEIKKASDSNKESGIRNQEGENIEK
jgi:F0F1-type ATP synthase assembly protein I